MGKLIRSYHFHALGDRTGVYWDSDEVLVYKPARVIPMSAHGYEAIWKGDTPVVTTISDPLDVTQLSRRKEQPPCWKD